MTEKKTQKKSIGVIELLMIPMCLAIIVIGAFVLIDNATKEKIKDKEVAQVHVLNAAKYDTPQQRLAMISALMADKEIQSLATAWLVQMSNLEAMEKYKERDAVFFQALGFLSPYEMRMFLEANKEHVLGYDRETLNKAGELEVSLHPVIQMSMKQRTSIRDCYTHLSESLKDLKKEKTDDMGLFKKVVVKMKVLYSGLFVPACNINPMFYGA